MPTPTADLSPAQPSDGLPRWLIAAGALVGVALRWFVLAGRSAVSTATKAVSALVSREVSHGRFPRSFPGEGRRTMLAYPRHSCSR